MRDCRNCPEFFELVGSGGYCVTPCVVEKEVPPVSDVRVWVLAVFFGLSGAFVGLVLTAGVFLVVH